MEVSVVVPMYNVESYILPCLESLWNQTLKDLEVILVDDGCTDSTCEKAEAYMQNHPGRFFLLHKKNGGLSDARNYGIPYAHGKYLAFLDSDDFAEPSLYEKMAARMKKEQDNVCVCDIEYWYENPDQRWIMKGLSSWKADTIQKRALLSPMFAWNKMYLRSDFGENGYRYPLNTWYEDIPVTSILFARAERIGYLPEALIHYRQREGSILQTSDSPRVQEIFGVMETVRSVFDKAGLSSQYHDELEYLHIEHLRLYGMFRFIRSSCWQSCWQKSEEVMQKYYPNWKKNPYLKNLSLKNRIFLKCYSSATDGLFRRFILK